MPFPKFTIYMIYYKKKLTQIDNLFLHMCKDRNKNIE